MPDNSEVVVSRDWSRALQVLRKLLLGTDLTDFRYTAGFSVEFSRSGKPPETLVPMVVRLTLRSNWRIGTAEAWHAVRMELPRSPARGEPDDPARAYMLTLVSGSRVEDLDVSDGNLSIRLGENDTLFVPGTEEEFEESWIADVPPDVPNAALWSVVCTDRGKVFCRYPSVLT